MYNFHPHLSHVEYNRLLPGMYSSSKAGVPHRKTTSPATYSNPPEREVSKHEKSADEKNLKIDPYRKEILYGILLGDASLATENGGRTYRLRLTQSESHKDYLYHLVSQFETFGKTGPKMNPANSTYYWNSLQSASFRFYAQEFYKKIENNKLEKKVPDNVKRWLTPRAAAYWFLDDGSAKDKKRTNAIRFCTDSFSISDVERLAEGLETNFDVKTSIYPNRVNQYRIYVKAASVSSFWDKVLPILENEIQPTAPNILTKLPHNIYTKISHSQHSSNSSSSTFS